jgi:RNA polymerase-binding transcription factor DksA
MVKKNNKKTAKSKPAKPELKKKSPPPSKARATKPVPVAKPARPAKPIARPAKPIARPAKPVGKVAKPVAKAEKPIAKPVKNSPIMEKPSKKNALRDSILKRKATTKPIAFSLDEVRAIAKTVVVKAGSEDKPLKTAKPVAAKALTLEKPAKPNHIKAASLADILGFNPKRSQAPDTAETREVPEKFKRFYRLLLDLRKHLTAGIELHSEETLKRSSKEDSGDLSSYGQHMADAGTDTFDRDFALSLVSSEQEALTEIDAAIKRIHDGSYGICEITQKPIAKERLLAVPFTRYSAEAQKDLEKNRYRSRTAGGLFGELGEEGGKIMEEDGGGDE